MARLKIVKFGDEMLRKVARPVDEITPRIKMLLDDMIETMRDADGCGLAAPQVGVLRRIAVIEIEPGVVYELINPKIIAFSGEQQEREGCLSNPGYAGITKRPMSVTVRAMDRNGRVYDLTVVLGHPVDLVSLTAVAHREEYIDGLAAEVKIGRKGVGGIFSG
jgi:peptide deformylase